MRRDRVAVALVAAISIAAPIFAQTPATYTGPNNGNWNTAGNWDIDPMVPINSGLTTYSVTIPASRTVLFDVPGAGNQISSLNVATTGGISFTPVGGGGLEVVGAATLGGIYQVTGDKTFRAVGSGTSFSNTRLLADTGGEIVVDADIDQYTGSHTGTTFVGPTVGLAIFQATGADGLGTGSLLDLQSLTQLVPTEANGTNGAELTVHAANKGTVDLRNVTTAGLTASQSADRLKFFIEGGASGDGNIRLDSLATVDRVRFDVRAGGQLTLGDVSSLTRSEMLIAGASGALSAGFVDAGGSLQFDATSSLSMQAGAVLRLGGDLIYRTSTEANFLTGPGIIEMQGPATRVLEVGGTDLGAGGAASSNFGIGQLTVGASVVPTTLVLVDAFDNGNRTGPSETDDEVLYLFGVGGQDGLKINTDSLVVLYGIDVYAFETGVGQVHLNSLFPVGVNEIMFDQGVLQLLDVINGDFNGDGSVNAADYTVWRDTLGMNGVNLRADADDDGTVTQLDYFIWKANYGSNIFEALSVGIGQGQSVPEPAIHALIIAGGLSVFTLRRRSLRRKVIIVRL